MSNSKPSQHPDHQDQSEQVLPSDAAPFDVISTATQALASHQRSAAIANAVNSSMVSGALSSVNLRIYCALLERLDWSIGMTSATTIADICCATHYTVRTVTRGLEVMVDRRMLLHELVPTELSGRARYYAFPALAGLARAGTASVVPPRQKVAKLRASDDTPRLNESQVQRAVVQHLMSRAVAQVFWFAVPNGGWRTKAEAAILNGHGVIAGVPDLIVIARGLPYGLELKPKHGVLSRVQQETHARMREAGAIVATTYGLDDALRQLETWGVLRPNASSRAR
ncbi:MAG: hypothetical protein AB7L90_07925 [Hyphomicrobiaceae bacterium]